MSLIARLERLHAEGHARALDVRSEVNRAILRTLAARGVEIPYPQRVVRQA